MGLTDQQVGHMAVADREACRMAAEGRGAEHTAGAGHLGGHTEVDEMGVGCIAGRGQVVVQETRISGLHREGCTAAAT